MKRGALLLFPLLFSILIVSGCNQAVGGLGSNRAPISNEAASSNSSVLESYRLIGDFNYDKCIDEIDFNMLQEEFKKPIEKKNLFFDLNEDNSVDFDDFFLFSDNFGRGCNKERGVVLVIVEQDLYGGLKPYLDTYGNDIRNELGLGIIIKKYDSSKEDLFDLKNYIKSIYFNGNLNGVLLVGDIPTATFFNPKIPSDSIFNKDGLDQGDCIYQDVFSECRYSSEEDFFETDGRLCCENDVISPYWVSRLTPNIDRGDSLSLLKDYFTRNHGYRTGQYSYNQEILIYSPLLEEKGIRKKKLIGLFEPFLENPYEVGEMIILGIGNFNSTGEYLEELSKPYEYLFINAHGTPTFHEGGNLGITSSELQDVGPFLIDFQSCSVGRFTSLNYLAGGYLFNGNALVVSAPSTPIWGTGYYSPIRLYVLASGEPVYKTLRVVGSNNADNDFGDLTLRMRYAKKSSTYENDDPTIKFDSSPLTFADGESKVLKIKNLGNSILKVQIVPMSYDDKGNQASIFAISSKSSLVRGIRPKDEGLYTINADLPSEDSTKKGEFFILSNDPIKPVTSIPFEIRR